MSFLKTKIRNLLRVVVAAAIVAGALCLPAKALKIRDVARLKNEAPSSLIGYGLVVGLKGTGDGGENVLAMAKLAALVRNLGDTRTLERDLKNANNVAIVQVTVEIPEQGAHAGEKLDAIVSSIGSAKSLRGGQLFLTPMLFPLKDRKLVLAMASGECMLDDETNPTRVRVRGGAVLTEDLLAEEIKDGRFTLVLHQNTANSETATAVADQINEDVKVETGGKPAAFAVDSTSVDVMIPPAELKNVTAFVARIRSLPLPNIPDPARVEINTKTKTIVFTQEVELAPTSIIHGNMSIEIVPALPAAQAAPGAAPAPGQNTKLRDLMDAFRLYKISPDDRIAIVRELHAANALKAELIIK